MFSVLLLDGYSCNKKSFPFVTEFVFPISDFQECVIEQPVLGFFKKPPISEQQLFFTLSHPYYFTHPIKLIISSYDGLKISNVSIVPEPAQGFFTGINLTGDQIKVLNFQLIDDLNSSETLFQSNLLIFNTNKDFIAFNEKLTLILEKNPLLFSLMAEVSKLRQRQKETLHLSQWNKNLVQVYETSLSLIRVEFQKDLQWYKDELQKVILWYEDNYEKLPPGFLWTGKKINKLLSRINFTIKK